MRRNCSQGERSLRRWAALERLRRTECGMRWSRVHEFWSVKSFHDSALAKRSERSSGSLRTETSCTAATPILRAACPKAYAPAVQPFPAPYSARQSRTSARPYVLCATERWVAGAAGRRRCTLPRMAPALLPQARTYQTVRCRRKHVAPPSTTIPAGPALKKFGRIDVRHALGPLQHQEERG